jgi:2,3-bisphosphoglycerate-independent phosphoglycerate mutase
MDFKEVKALGKKRSSKYSAEIVNEFIFKSMDVLSDHKLNWKRIGRRLNPANIILTRGTGNHLPKLEGFNKEQLRWLCIGDTPGERGVAKLLRMDVIEIDNPLSDELPSVKDIDKIEDMVEEDMEEKIRIIKHNLDKYDCFYIHIKGPDPFGHHNSPKKKAKVISVFDKVFMGKLLDMIDLNESVMCITSDHCTSCEHQAHTGDPVPVVIAGNWVERDKVIKFGEKFCKKGGLKTIKGTELMNILMGEFWK